MLMGERLVINFFRESIDRQHSRLHTVHHICKQLLVERPKNDIMDKGTNGTATTLTARGRILIFLAGASHLIVGTGVGIGIGFAVGRNNNDNGGGNGNVTPQRRAPLVVEAPFSAMVEVDDDAGGANEVVKASSASRRGRKAASKKLPVGKMGGGQLQQLRRGRGLGKSITLRPTGIDDITDRPPATAPPAFLSKSGKTAKPTLSPTNEVSARKIAFHTTSSQSEVGRVV